MKRRRVLLVIAMSIGVTVLHYTTAINSLPWHTVYRELYFVPIVLSGLWFGKKWGLANSILVSLVYVPHMLELIQAQE